MKYNYENIVFTFNSTCLNGVQANFLSEYDFHTFQELTRGYVQSEVMSQFLLDYENITNPKATESSLYIFKFCLLDLGFEEMFDIQDNCLMEPTHNLQYQITTNGDIFNKSLPSAWNLDLLDQTSDSSYKYPNKQLEDDRVVLWILDTGVNANHVDFFRNQVESKDETYNAANITHPHGTGCAAIAGGIRYGSSKNFKIFDFPVCRYGGSCGSSWVDKALNYILNYTRTQFKSGKRSVINMSFGTTLGFDPTDTSLGKYYNALFKEITDNGGIFVTSAGNSNQDSCNWLYSFSPYVISVGSIDQSYKKSGFSNFGPCVDLWSFGSNVLTAYSAKDNYTVQAKSGTSFSGPLVAGMIANLLFDNITLSREQIINILSTNRSSQVFPVASYDCTKPSRLNCCRGKKAHTRQDAFCRQLPWFACEASRCNLEYC